MPRIRTLKPEHKQHRKVGRLSDRAYRLWVGLITEADDEGRLVEDLPQFRALIFAYQDLSVKRVRAALAEILDTGLLTRYEVRGVPYLAFQSWHAHQVINKRRPSTLPPFPSDSRNGTGALPDDSRMTPVGSEGSEGSEGKERSGTEPDGNGPGVLTHPVGSESASVRLDLLAIQTEQRRRRGLPERVATILDRVVPPEPEAP